jgi:diguanylate cyclase (GGDEF)-like protein
VPDSRSRLLLRRIVPIGAVALGLLWAAVAVEQLVSGGHPLVVALALAGMGLTWGLAVAIRRYQSRLEGLARTDPLTGLANHRGFHDGLETAIAAASRSGEDVAVVLADLDDFKGVNDARGHSHGDRVLIALANRLRACVRSGDLIGRIGGEEFAVVVRGGAGRAADLASRIRGAVAYEPVLGEALT